MDTRVILHTYAVRIHVSLTMCKAHFSKHCPIALAVIVPIYTPTCRAFKFLTLFVKILFQLVFRFSYIFVWLEGTCRYKRKEDREKLGELWPSWPLPQWFTPPFPYPPPPSVSLTPFRVFQNLLEEHFPLNFLPEPLPSLFTEFSLHLNKFSPYSWF